MYQIPRAQEAKKINMHGVEKIQFQQRSRQHPEEKSLQDLVKRAATEHGSINLPYKNHDTIKLFRISTRL